MSDDRAGLHRQAALGKHARLQIGRDTVCQRFRLLGDKVHQVMHMEHIARGEHAGDAGLIVFVHVSALCPPVQQNARREGKLVLRDQADGKHQGIAGEVLLRPGNGAHFLVHLHHRNALNALLALDFDHGVA